MKKEILIPLVVLGSISLYAADENTNLERLQLQTQEQLQTRLQVQNNDTVVDESLELSQTMTRLTQRLRASIQNAEGQYTKDMVESADQIEALSTQMRALSEKIDPTREILSNNFALTQRNMLNSQTQLRDTLDELEQQDKLMTQEMVQARNRIQEKLQVSSRSMDTAQNRLNNTQQTKAVKQLQQSISISSVTDLVGMLDNVKPQYRFMVMNAIKSKLAQQNSKERIEKLDQLQNMLKNARQEKEFNMSSLNSAMGNVQADKDKAFNAGGEDRGASSSSDGLAGVTGSSSSSSSSSSSGSSSGGSGSSGGKGGK